MINEYYDHFRREENKRMQDHYHAILMRKREYLGSLPRYKGESIVPKCPIKKTRHEF
jgi:hypothetical protein